MPLFSRARVWLVQPRGRKPVLTREPASVVLVGLRQAQPLEDQVVESERYFGADDVAVVIQTPVSCARSRVRIDFQTMEVRVLLPAGRVASSFEASLIAAAQTADFCGLSRSLATTWIQIEFPRLVGLPVACPPFTLRLWSRVRSDRYRSGAIFGLRCRGERRARRHRGLS
jgi:hypothetical protein